MSEPQSSLLLVAVGSQDPREEKAFDREASLEEGFWPILALDHGLTVGHGASVSIVDIVALLDGCEGSIGSVVMTY